MDLLKLKQEIESKAYEIYFESLPAPDEPWRKFVSIETNTSNWLKITDSMAYADKLEPWEYGESLVYEEPKQGYTVVGRVRAFRKARKIPWHTRQVKSVIDEIYNQVQNWAEAVGRTRDDWIAAMFNNGALVAGHSVFNQTIPQGADTVYPDPTGDFIYDGKPFFANIYNDGTTDYDNRHPLKVDPSQLFENYVALPLTYENLLDVYKKMRAINAVDDYGRKMDIRPDILLVPPALEVTALQLVNAEFAPNDTTTPSKPNPFRGVLQVVVWDALEHADGWFLIDSKLKGIEVFDNPEDVEIRTWIDEETQEFRIQIIAKFGAYVRNWRAFFGCNIPQS